MVSNTCLGETLILKSFLNWKINNNLGELSILIIYFYQVIGKTLNNVSVN